MRGLSGGRTLVSLVSLVSAVGGWLLWGALTAHAQPEPSPAGTEPPPQTTASAWVEDVEPPPTGAVPLTTLISAPTDEPAFHVKHHYMWSNERRHDIFYADLKELGGGYIGVGGDQNYSLAAAAKAEVLWLIDLDASVTRMHRLYTSLILESPTAKAFLAMFEPKAAARVEKALAAHCPESERPAVQQLYEEYGEDLHRYLRRSYHQSHHPTWLSDDGMYQYIRGLAQRGQIIARVGNLAGPKTMLEIAAAARRAGVQVSALYLSNAESWFRYNEDLHRNLSALPWHERGVVLRTVKSELLAYAHGDAWHFSVQSGSDFARKLGEPGYRSVEVAMLDAVVAPRPHGLSHIAIGPPAPDGQSPLTALLATLPDAPRYKHDEHKHDQQKALLDAGLVTRPAGNRVRASILDAEHRERAAERTARHKPRLRARGDATTLQ